MGGERKVYTFAEVSQHNNYNDCWLIIEGKVYDCTKFLDDHPGGGDVVVSSTGKDATDDFEDVGHSQSAKKMLNDYYIGDIDLATMPNSQVKFTTPAPKQPQPQPQPPQNNQGKTSSDFAVTILQFVVPLIILAVAVGIRFYTKST